MCFLSWRSQVYQLNCGLYKEENHFVVFMELALFELRTVIIGQDFQSLPVFLKGTFTSHACCSFGAMPLMKHFRFPE